VNRKSEKRLLRPKGQKRGDECIASKGAMVVLKQRGCGVQGGPVKKTRAEKTKGAW